MSIRKSIGNKGPLLLPEGTPASWETVAATAATTGKVLVAHAHPLTTPSVKPIPRPPRNKTASTNHHVDKNTAFDRLYQKGKEQSERQALRVNLKYKRPPIGCTFAPITNTVQAAISPIPTITYVNELLNAIVGSIETIGSSGGLQSRDLLHAEYQSRMLEYHRRRQVDAINATRRQTDAFEDLFKDGKVKLEEKLKKEKESKERVPVDCTFQPMLSPSLNKKVDETKTKYIKRAKMNAAKKSSKGPIKRTDLLYAERLEEREKKKVALQQRLKEDAKYIIKNPHAMPETTAAAADKNTKKKRISPRSPRGVDADGRFIKYNKMKHRKQIERIEFLRQSKECTFSPKVNKTNKPGMGDGGPSDVVNRLLEDGQKRNKRKEKRVEVLPTNCTFAPAINKDRGEIASKSRGDDASNRLYNSGKKALQKREKKYANRERPTFRPDLSATARYRAKRPKERRKGNTKKSANGGRGGNNLKGNVDVDVDDVKDEDSNNKKKTSYDLGGGNDEGEEEEDEYLGEEAGDVRGLKGVSDKIEDEMIQNATVLQKKDTERKDVADDANQKGKILCHAVAMYDFSGKGSNGKNLSMKAGQIIQVNEMDLESYPETDGWWHGRIKGEPWGKLMLYPCCTLAVCVAFFS